MVKKWRLRQDDAPIDHIVLHGGGSPLVCMYDMLFEKLGLRLDDMPFDLTVASASCVWFCHALQEQTGVTKIDRMHIMRKFRQFMLDVDIVGVLEANSPALYSKETLRELMREAAPDVYHLTLAEVGKRLSRRVTIVTTRVVNKLAWERIDLSPSDTPDVLLIDALYASMAVPIAFEPGDIVIRGVAMECIDGDLSLSAKNADEVHLQPRSSLTTSWQSYSTDIAIVDRALLLCAQLFTAATAHHVANRSLKHRLIASLDAEVYSEEQRLEAERLRDEFVVAVVSPHLG